MQLDLSRFQKSYSAHTHMDIYVRAHTRTHTRRAMQVKGENSISPVIPGGPCSMPHDRQGLPYFLCPEPTLCSSPSGPSELTWTLAFRKYA